MDVYCCDCKNHELWRTVDVCKLDVYKDEVGTERIPHHRTCENRNKGKKCADFKVKFFKKYKYRNLL